MAEGEDDEQLDEDELLDKESLDRELGELAELSELTALDELHELPLVAEIEEEELPDELPLGDVELALIAELAELAELPLGVPLDEEMELTAELDDKTPLMADELLDDELEEFPCDEADAAEPELAAADELLDDGPPLDADECVPLDVPLELLGARDVQSLNDECEPLSPNAELDDDNEPDMGNSLTILVYVNVVVVPSARGDDGGPQCREATACLRHRVAELLCCRRSRALLTRL